MHNSFARICSFSQFIRSQVCASFSHLTCILCSSLWCRTIKKASCGCWEMKSEKCIRFAPKITCVSHCIWRQYLLIKYPVSHKNMSHYKNKMGCECLFMLTSVSGWSKFVLCPIKFLLHSALNHSELFCLMTFLKNVHWQTLSGEKKCKNCIFRGTAAWHLSLIYP